MSVLVRTFTGEILSQSTDPTLLLLCGLAGERDLPFLGMVDAYDNTVFNRLQARRIADELKSLRDLNRPEINSAVEEVSNLVGIVLEKPHRYLVFNGD